MKALILDGRVQELFPDAVPEFHSSIADNIIDVPDDTVTGMIYYGNAFYEYLPEDRAREIRLERDTLLRESDFSQLEDAPIDLSTLSVWRSYRQALRDITNQETFPESVDWPVKP